MGPERVAHQFSRKVPERGIAVIEGNRGLFDGVDIKGSYSTAELAKLLDAPVLVVVDATKVTRTTAALVLGCQKLDPGVGIRGVILNRVSGERHKRIATGSIEDTCGIPVLGAVPRLSKIRAPERHLGLVTPEETPDAKEWVDGMVSEIEPYLDVERIAEFAGSAGEFRHEGESDLDGFRSSAPVKIGVIRDSAFPFYYPENLESLEKAGACLVWIRAVDDPELPELDALYLGGGFPETHAGVLSGNRRFSRSLKRAVKSGLPVYAECGGMIYLGRRLYYQGKCYKMAGILPVDFEFCKKPQGHGYTEWMVDGQNPFYPEGLEVRGHEFHYTRIKEMDKDALETVCRVNRGQGLDGEREGMRINNLVAFYGHVHVMGCPDWARGMIRAAGQYAKTG
jgi:cobyrinic acid a,c-diamide synthase